MIDVWDTVQGEGPFAGTPAVFVRLSGCNIKCPGCFGISKKSRIPKLYRSVGPSVRLDKVQVGEKILTFNADMELVETEVKEVHRRKVTEWLELRIAGNTYDVTPEHPFFTTRGMIAAEDLEVGDMVLESRPNEIIAFKKRGDRNPMKRPEVAARSTANTDYAANGKKVSATIRAKQEAGTYLHFTETLTDQEKEDLRHKQSEAKKGGKNPNWKGEHPNLNDVQVIITDGTVTICTNCQLKKDRLLVHHLDGDHGNDAIDNLVVWCHKCHNQHHERGYNFWNGKRTDGKQLVKDHNGQEVQKVTRCSGKLEVCNVTCGPEPTFLANGMLVHNCDTDYTSGRLFWTVSEIAYRVAALRPSSFTRVGIVDGEPVALFAVPSLVVLTGGEPFRQPIGPLVRELLASGYRVQVETNGTVFLDDFPYLGDVTVVCSPKTPVVAEPLRRYVAALKYVLHHSSVSGDDGLPLTTLDGPCKVARPWHWFAGEIYVQPMDTQDAADNALSLAAAVASCRKYSYRVSVQTHKMLGVA